MSNSITDTITNETIDISPQAEAQRNLKTYNNHRVHVNQCRYCYRERVILKFEHLIGGTSKWIPYSYNQPTQIHQCDGKTRNTRTILSTLTISQQQQQNHE